LRPDRASRRDKPMPSSACATVTPSASLRDKISSVVKSPNIGGRRHHRRRKARAFLVGPVADADRHFRLDPGVVQGPDDFERGERAEHAVELAAGRLGCRDGNQGPPAVLTCRVPCAGRTSSRAHRHAPRAPQPRRRCGNQSRTCSSSGQASAAARRLWEWREFLRFQKIASHRRAESIWQVGCDFGHSAFRKTRVRRGGLAW